MSLLRIALSVFKSIPNDVELNIDHTAKVTSEAKQRGADIICFPEMNLTGYNLRSDLRGSAQSIPGPGTKYLLELADRDKIAILAGLAEVDNTGRMFASHVIALPKNELHVYRKTHLPPPEKQIFSYGNTVSLFRYQGLCMGVQLCYDAHFPELTTLMALKGVDLIFFPHASPRGTPKEKINSWMRHLTARAFDNGVFVAACNQAGDNGNGASFPGVALFISPSGEMLAYHDSGEEGLLLTTLDTDMLDQVRKHPMGYFLPHRRPEIYGIC